MATFNGQVKDNQILLIVWVRHAGAENEAPTAYNALLDTGAQRTMISELVAAQVGLQDNGNARIIPVTGEPFDTKKYRIRLDIPIESPVTMPDGSRRAGQTFRGKDMEVALLPYAPKNHDVLLGMDFLSEFHLTLYGGNFILSN